MARKKGHTDEKELNDAIRRIGQKREAKQATKNSQTWYDYLVDVLDINPNTVESDRGKVFWNDVRRGIQGKKAIERPTLRQIQEANSQEEYWPTKTGQVIHTYRNKETGQFMSAKKIIYGS